MKQEKCSLFYKPADAWAGDFIPFYKDGSFHLFYLKDWRDRKVHGEGTPWWKISTKDFLHFTEHGEMLPRGSQDEQDLYVFTGSVLAANGQYHIFYTGCNPHFRKAGKPEQGVMHAVSADLENWTKIPEDTFYAPVEGYEPHDWRDPFVFWNDDAGEYWMLLAARLSRGPSRRRGCTALCASPDLKTWRVREPFWSPGLYFTHECPDLFKMGNWWYLVYSTFSERMITHYRMSRSIEGPWSAPENDAFDSRAYYAAKTWSDGVKRYAFGWIPSRENETDRGNWQWGGHLLVHELVQNEDGSLGVKPPETIEQALTKEERIDFTKGLRHWQANEKQVLLEDRDGFSCAAADSLSDPCIIQMDIVFQKHTRGCGIMLRARLYDLKKGGWGLFVNEGVALFENISVRS